MPREPDEDQGQPRRKEVAIFGAGIAGLTAAHELIERGYRVEVFEKAEASIIDLLTNRTCDVGGKARTQWSRAERPDLQRHDKVMRSTHPITPLQHYRIFFQAGSADLDDDAEERISAVAGDLRDAAGVRRQFGPLLRCIEVRGYSRKKDLDTLPNNDPKDREDYRRAEAVAARLRQRLTVATKGRKPDGPSCAIEPYPVQDEAEDGIDQKRKKKAAPRVVGAADEAATILLRPLPMGLGLRDDWSAPDYKRDYVDFHVVEDLIPGEHGFRFFPSFYRNLSDTMTRTPIAVDGNLYVETSGTVLDNLVATKRQMIALRDSAKSFAFPRKPTGSAQEAFDQLVKLMQSQGYSLDDIQRGNMKVFKYATSCPERRAAFYEYMSWWDFVEGDTFGEAFQKYFDDTGQTLLAMRTKECDARTYGNITVQMMMDQVRTGTHTDGTLNGPTSVAWFDHWRRYLERQGVEFRRGELIDFIEHDEETLWPVVQLYPPRGEVVNGPPKVVMRDYYVLAVSDVATRELCAKLKGDDFDRLRGWVGGDLTKARPGGPHAHMSGIQFYFPGDLEFVDGHVDYADAEWGLTSISQPQFWTRQRGWWSGYRGVLSVDICDWFTKSPVTKRAAWDSTKHQIAEEVWRQIRESFTPEQLNCVPEKPPLYHLDTNIRFKQRDNGNWLPALNETPFTINLVGDYVRRPGKPGKYSLWYNSLVLAGDFMQTYTRMTTMEATNESARHAVNAILKADDYQGDRCQTFNPEEYEAPELRYLIDLDRRMFEEGLPHFMDLLNWTHVEVRKALRHGDEA